MLKQIKYVLNKITYGFQNIWVFKIIKGKMANMQAVFWIIFQRYIPQPAQLPQSQQTLETPQ